MPDAAQAVARQIIALGGGGFSMEDDNTLIDDYVLAAARAKMAAGGRSQESPRVCFVPTASGDSEAYIECFLAAFHGRAEASVLRLFHRNVDDVDAFVATHDVIYVGGGNTVNALAVWRAHAVVEPMRRAYESGCVMTGISAGMICWFEASITDSYLDGTSRALHDGLGFLEGSACPHYDGEASRRPAYSALVAQGFPPGYAADDSVALHFVDEKLTGVISSQPDRHAYRVHCVEGAVAHHKLAVTRLGA